VPRVAQVQTSGKFSPLVFAYAALAAVAGVAVSYVYMIAMEWIPIIILNAALTFGFAFLLLLAMSFVVTRGKCRNTAMALVLALAVGGIVTAGGHWFGYQYALNNYVESGAIPPTFAEYIDWKVKTGWTISRGSSGGFTISGIFVYLIWLIEWGVLVGGAVLGAANAVKEPYCEHCDAWTEADLLNITFPDPPISKINAIENAGSTDELLSVDLSTGDPTANTIVYSLYGCPSCDESAFLTINHVTVTKDSEGNDQTNTNALHEGVVLSPEQLEALVALKETGRRGTREIAADEQHEAAGDALAEMGES